MDTVHKLAVTSLLLLMFAIPFYLLRNQLSFLAGSDYMSGAALIAGTRLAHAQHHVSYIPETSLLPGTVGLASLGTNIK